MSLYRTWVFPRLMHAVMSSEAFTRIRHEVLAEASGNTLEIGFGSGLNLEHYPPQVEHLTAIDVNPGMTKFARRQASGFPRGLDIRTLSCESLPFDDQTFDSIVSTWTLCSVPDVQRALREVFRVLKQDGRFFFVEHGLSPDPRVRKWQHRLTPFERRLADGCHLDRDIPALILGAGFEIRSLETFYLEGVPRVGGYFYKGVGTRSDRSAVRQ